MDSTTIHRSIAAFRAQVSGEYSSATRVVDALLDLRNFAAGSPALLDLIDSTIADIPGWFVVPNHWWRDHLDQIERVVLVEESSTAGAGAG